MRAIPEKKEATPKLDLSRTAPAEAVVILNALLAARQHFRQQGILLRIRNRPS